MEFKFYTKGKYICEYDDYYLFYGSHLLADYRYFAISEYGGASVSRKQHNLNYIGFYDI